MANNANTKRSRALETAVVIDHSPAVFRVSAPLRHPRTFGSGSRRECLRLNDADRGRAHESQPPRVDLDTPGRVEPRALDDEKGVLAAKLVALSGEPLGLVAQR